MALWRRQGFDPAYRNLLLAVSGGADSVALLRYFACEVRPWVGCTLRALHVHHGLRPAREADADAAFTVELGRQWQVPVQVVHLDPSQRLPSESVEAWARRERYSALQSFADEPAHPSTSILTAHHRDDLLETMALRLLRGEGWRALTGMTFMRPPGIVRPFLHVPGKDLRAYLHAHGQAWREDATNDETRFLRNHLRHRILPRIWSQDPPQADMRDRLYAISQNLRALTPFLDHLEPLTPHRQGGQSYWHFSDLADPLHQGDHTLVLQRLRTLLQAAHGPMGQPKKTFLRGFQLKGLTTGSKRLFGVWSLTSGWSLHLEAIHLHSDGAFHPGEPCFTVEKAQPVLASEAAIEVSLENLPQTCQFVLGGGHYRFTVKALSRRALKGFPAAQENRVVCDADAFSSTLQLRSRQAGDRFSPLGIRSRSRKLNTYFNEHRVPAIERNTLPLVVSNGRVAWVPGHALSEWFKVMPHSEHLYELVLEPNGSSNDLESP
jgi:tRNA(Ile)-lysidine synthase